MSKELPILPDLVRPAPEPEPINLEYVEIENAKKVRPWHLFNKNKERSPDALQKERMDICKECPFFIKVTGQCSKCGCIMEAKTRLAEASCPVDKWQAVKLIK
jgi:hypothetical protein